MRLGILLLFFCSLTFLARDGKANPLAAKYGMSINSEDLTIQTKQAYDSLMTTNPMLIAETEARVERFRHRDDNTFDLYWLIAIVLFFGVINFTNGRYFYNLWRSFRNPELSQMQLKDQLMTAGWTGLFMNIFFAVSLGTYLYYVTTIFYPQRLALFSPSVLLLIFISAVLVVYIVKYTIIRFSGWIFNFKMVADNYLFNVFLINKVIAILLLPIIVLLAFAKPAMYAPLAIVSFVLVGLLLINRYLRSWQVIGSVFQYSRFHFFTYLCASELLPMAVLIKMLTSIIYY
ncbi:MAG: DUF4271 domain-containing protein [Flavipsychrobacter sp.]